MLYTEIEEILKTEPQTIETNIYISKFRSRCWDVSYCCGDMIVDETITMAQTLLITFTHDVDLQIGDIMEHDGETYELVCWAVKTGCCRNDLATKDYYYEQI